MIFDVRARFDVGTGEPVVEVRRRVRGAYGPAGGWKRMWAGERLSPLELLSHRRERLRVARPIFEFANETNHARGGTWQWRR